MGFIVSVLKKELILSRTFKMRMNFKGSTEEKEEILKGAVQEKERTGPLNKQN